MSKGSEKPEGIKRYHFRLFVAGDEPNSRRAKEALNRFCEVYLKKNYKIEIVDVLKDFRSALENNVLLAPTLLILEPPMGTKLIGSLNDERRLLEVLGLSEGRKGDEEKEAHL